MRRRNIGFPRSSKRGLGLLDALLAVIVLAVIGTMGWQVVSIRIDRSLLANEGRALSTLARAGRVWVAGDPGNRAPDYVTDTTPPDAVDFSDLVTANLRGADDPERTPARRDMTLWLWPEANERILVLARARGEASRHTPDAIDGVPGFGVVEERAGVLRLTGADVTLDVPRLNSAMTGFAQAGDLVAIDHVFTSAATCPSPFLSREDSACATMMIPLNMDGNDLINLGAGSLAGITLDVEEIIGSVTIPAALTVTEDVTVEGILTIPGILEVHGDVAMVDGTIQSNSLTAGTVRTDEVFATEGAFSRLSVDALTVGSCTGCVP